MNRSHLLAVLTAALLAGQVFASGLGEPEFNVPQRIVEESLFQDVSLDDPLVKKAAEQVAAIVKATGEQERAIAQLCNRHARYIFDVSHQRAKPMEVLEAVAFLTRKGKSFNEAAQLYHQARAKQRLDHAAAMTQLASVK
jgi:hypothetical protein